MRVIYAYGGGRLGNQVLRFAHWLAWAHANQPTASVLDPAFWPHAHLFETWSAHPGCAWPRPSAMADFLSRARRLVPAALRDRVRPRVERRVAAFLGSRRGSAWLSLDDAAGEGVALDASEFAARASGLNRLVCTGWKFSAWPLLARHETDVRQLLAPQRRRSVATAARLGEWRHGSEVLVGVFMRGTDYREWHEGRFLFPAETYAGWMRQIVGLYRSARVRFVVAGDVACASETFAGLDWRWSSGAVAVGGDSFDSFLELGGCDFVLSPPSTFSACAAWLGQRALWPLVAREQTLERAQLLPHALFDAYRHPEFGLAVK